MSTQTLKIVEQNTAPPIVIVCKRTDGSIIDLTGCAVALNITNGVVQTNTGHAGCVVTTPTAGLVTYTPQIGDFPTSGTYTCDVVITYGGGGIETLYDQLKIKARLKALSTS